MQDTGCSHELARLDVRHLVHLLEALDQIAVAGALVRHVHRAVAVQARARLLGDLLPLGERLVVEHVRVAALLAEVLREGVAGPHRPQPRVLLEPRLRDDRARIGRGRRVRHAPRCRRSACAAGRRCAGSRRTGAGSSCPRSPGRRSCRSSSTTRIERVARLLLALEDVHEQRGDARRRRARRRPRRGRASGCRSDGAAGRLGRIGVLGHDVLGMRRASRAAKWWARIIAPSGRRSGGSGCTRWARPRGARVVRPRRRAPLRSPRGELHGARRARRGVVDRLGDLGVAGAAGVLGDASVSLGDAKGIGIAADREVERVPEAVARLHRVLGNQRVRRVTVVARRHGVMAPLGPRGEVLAHDVAVRARRRIVAEVRVAARVPEGEQARVRQPCRRGARRTRAHVRARIRRAAPLCSSGAVAQGMVQSAPSALLVTQ